MDIWHNVRPAAKNCPAGTGMRKIRQSRDFNCMTANLGCAHFQWSGTWPFVDLIEELPSKRALLFKTA
jgi:hypothetical protein